MTTIITIHMGRKDTVANKVGGMKTIQATRTLVQYCREILESCNSTLMHPISICMYSWGGITIMGRHIQPVPFLFVGCSTIGL